MEDLVVVQVPSMLLVVTDGEKVRAQILPPSFRYQQMYNTLQQISKLMKSARYAHCSFVGPMQQQSTVMDLSCVARLQMRYSNATNSRFMAL